jgi:hypothetical protein
MAPENTGCKELTEDDFLEMIDNSPEIKEKLEGLGISHDAEGLKVLLNYYDLLTEEEHAFLKEDLVQFFSDVPNGDIGLFIKFSKKPTDRTFCGSNVICDSCYKSLLEVRKHKGHLKHRLVNDKT